MLVEDETPIRKLLEINLETNGYKAIHAQNGKEGIQLAANYLPDLILLDLGLPDMSGHTVLEELKQWYQGPVLILSVQKSEEDIIRALDNGATDYLTKPFRTGELLARIRACLRRSDGLTTEPTISCGPYKLDIASRRFWKQEEEISLTPTEYKLLLLLMENRGRVLTHAQVLKEIWGTGYQLETQYLRVFIGQLRKKLDLDQDEEKLLTTIPGVGYRFG